MRKISFFILSICLTSMSFSQTLQNSLDKQDWRIIPGLSGAVDFMDFGNPVKESQSDFAIGQVTVSPTQTVAIVAYNKKDYGVIEVDNKLNLLWSIHITGVPVAIGKFHDKLLLIASSGTKGGGTYIENEFNGMILDPSDGSIVLQKNIYPKINGFGTEPTFIFNKATKDFKLLIRNTDSKGRPAFIFSADSFDKGLETTKECKVVNFNQDLSEASRADFPVRKDQLLTQMETNDNGEVFASYFDGGNTITVEKIDASNKVSASKSLMVHAKNKTEFTTRIFPGKINPAIVFVTLKYKNENKDMELSLSKLDFSSNASPVSVQTVLDKDFKKSNESISLTLGKKNAKPETKDWDNMDITDIKEYNDKIIVFKESAWAEIHFNSNLWYYSGDGILTVYDNNMKPLAEQVLPKKMQMNLPLTLYSSLYIHNNILSVLMTTNINMGISLRAEGDPLYAEFDLQNNKMTKFEILEKDASGSQEKHSLPDAKSSLWFPDGFILCYLTARGIGINDIDCYPQRISF